MMWLSPLQKYILLECLNSKNYRLNKKKLDNFYEQHLKKPKPGLRVKIISRSIERLIKRELLIGYGIKTAHKWFIDEIRLTAQGRAVARKLLGEQVELPFKHRKHSKLNN